MKANANASGSKRSTPRIGVIIGLLAAVFAILAAVGLAGCGPKQVDVPNLVYLSRDEAQAELEKAGLKLGEVSEGSNGELKLGDIVWKQSPEAGGKADEGSAVNVTVSVGPKMGDEVVVPDITGKTIEEAEKALSDVLLIPMPGTPVTSDTVEPGKICAQSVPAGSKVKVLDPVTYAISLGKEKVAVPDVAGKPIAEARDILAKAGLGCDTTGAYNDKVAKDTVISQSVVKDQQVDKGTVVTLEVSLGVKPPDKVAVPDIYTYNLAGAKGALESAGLKYSYSGDEAGTVTFIDPAPGTKVDQGSTVKFELSVPKPTPPEPTPTIVKNHLTKKQVEEIVWENGLGQLEEAQKVELNDNIEYWEVTCSDTNGKQHVFVIDPDGKVSPV